MRGDTLPRSAPHLEEERLTISATQRQFGTILQHHEMIAMEQRLYFGNGAFAHHNRAAYSNELLRAELGYHTLDCLARYMRVIGRSDDDVLVCSLDPEDLLHRDKPDAGFVLDGDSPTPGLRD